MQLELIYDGLLLDVLIGIDILLNLSDSDLFRLLLSILLLSQRIHRVLHLLDRFIGDLLVFLLKIEQLVPQKQQLPHLCSIIHGELLDHFLFFFDLLFVLLDQSVVVGALTGDFRIFFRN